MAPRTRLDCETVLHITLKSIAQTAALDPIFAKHQPIFDEKLVTLNTALAREIPPDPPLQKGGVAKAVTEADRRRWLPPPAHRDPKLKLTVDARFAGWYEWEVPFDADPDWPEAKRPTACSPLPWKAWTSTTRWITPFSPSASTRSRPGLSIPTTTAKSSASRKPSSPTKAPETNSPAPSRPLWTNRPSPRRIAALRRRQKPPGGGQSHRPARQRSHAGASVG